MANPTDKRDAKALEMYNNGVATEVIKRELRIGANRLYRLVYDSGAKLRSSYPSRQGRKSLITPPDTSRSNERRDCAHYYPEEGCLHQAARDDIPCVPCLGCAKYEAGDNYHHHFDVMSYIGWGNDDNMGDEF